MPSGEHLKGKSPHGFGSHPENINRNGRPKALRNVIKDLFIEEFNVQLSSSQANEMIMAMLCMTERQVSELGERDDVPFWLKMISKKLIVNIQRYCGRHARQYSGTGAALIK
jgi:hypothetical protein